MLNVDKSNFSFKLINLGQESFNKKPSVDKRILVAVALPFAQLGDFCIRLIKMTATIATGILTLPFYIAILIQSKNLSLLNEFSLPSAFIHLVKAIQSLFSAIILPFVYLVNPLYVQKYYNSIKAIAQKKNEIKQLNDEFSTLQQNNLEVQRQLANTKKSLQQKEENLGTIQQQLEQLTSHYKKTEERVQELVQQKANVEQQLQKQEVLNHSQISIQELSEQIDILKKDQQSKKQELEKLKDNLEKEEKALTNLSQQNSHLSGLHLNQQEQITNLEAERLKLVQKLDKKNQEFKELSKILKQREEQFKPNCQEAQEYQNKQGILEKQNQEINQIREAQLSVNKQVVDSSAQLNLTLQSANNETKAVIQNKTDPIPDTIYEKFDELKETQQTEALEANKKQYTQMLSNFEPLVEYIKAQYPSFNIDKYKTIKELQEDGYPFHFALQKQDTKLAHLLFKAGGNIEQANAEGYTIFLLTINDLYQVNDSGNIENSIQFIQLLIGSNFNFLINNTYREVLYTAIAENAEKLSNIPKALDLIQQLFSEKNSINEKPAVIFLRNCNHPQIADFFIEKGFSIDHANFLEQTPLYVAISEKHLKLIEALIQKGANLLYIDTKHNKNLSPFELLLQKTPINSNYQTQLNKVIDSAHFSEDKESLDILSIFKKYPPKISHFNQFLKENRLEAAIKLIQLYCENGDEKSLTFVNDASSLYLNFIKEHIEKADFINHDFITKPLPLLLLSFPKLAHQLAIFCIGREDETSKKILNQARLHFNEIAIKNGEKLIDKLIENKKIKHKKKIITLEEYFNLKQNKSNLKNYSTLIYLNFALDAIKKDLLTNYILNENIELINDLQSVYDALLVIEKYKQNYFNEKLNALKDPIKTQVSKIFTILKKIVGEDIEISIDYRLAILELLTNEQINPPAYQDFKKYLLNAKKEKLKNLNAVDLFLDNKNNGICPLQQIFLSNIQSKITDNCGFEEEIWTKFVKNISAFNTWLIAKVGIEFNTQLITDSIELALNSDTNETIREKAATKQEQIIAPFLKLEDHQLALAGFRPYEEYEVKVKNEWKIKNNENVLVWKGTFACKNQKGFYQLHSLHKGEIDFEIIKNWTLEDKKKALSFVQKYCQGDKSSHEKLEDITRISPELRLALCNKSDFWKWIDSDYNKNQNLDESTIPLAYISLFKQVIFTYNALLATSKQFAKTINIAMISVFVGTKQAKLSLILTDNAIDYKQKNLTYINTSSGPKSITDKCYLAVSTVSNFFKSYVNTDNHLGKIYKKNN